MATHRGLMSRIGAEEDRPPSAATLAEAVAAHMRALLNTRQGDAVAAPDLGIVDFTELVHGFPFSIPVLSQSIRATLLKYEPRLKHVTVKHLPSDDPLELKFEIVAQLHGRPASEQLRFQTQMKPGGKIEVW